VRGRDAERPPEEEQVKVLVIGATGTIGREVVKRLAEEHDVLLGSRTIPGLSIDITSPASIRAFLEAVGPVDGVVCVAGDARLGSMGGLTDDDYDVGLRSKLMGQVNVTRVAVEFIRDEGSITLTSGVTDGPPMQATTSISMVNAAIEGFVRAAALELPRGIRINAVAPPWTVETLALLGVDTTWGVPAAHVAFGYVESVEGNATGMVIDPGRSLARTDNGVSAAVA
jgi:NAD(P)-dependent dehydrogenase (short-subunit alcohol dehydrogenase family)